VEKSVAKTESNCTVVQRLYRPVLAPLGQNRPLEENHCVKNCPFAQDKPLLSCTNFLQQLTTKIHQFGF